MNHASTWVIGLALAAGIALAAREARALSTSGSLAAAAIGTIATMAGWSWAVMLVAYFVSASLLSRFRAAEKEARLNGRVEKAGPRDAAQVLANGGVFAAAAFAYWWYPHPTWQVLAAGALSASAADTWATEIGVLSRQTPRSLLTWTPVLAGTSGGVTAQGLLAGAGGASFVVILTRVAGWPDIAALAALVGGLFGCLLDSAVGASMQARRWCVSCAVATEQRTHRCGIVTAVTGGFEWLDNDGVNAIATMGGALAGVVFARFVV